MKAIADYLLLNVSLELLMMFNMSVLYKFYITGKEIKAYWTDLELFKSNVLSKLSTLFIHNSTISSNIVTGWNKYYFGSSI